MTNRAKGLITMLIAGACIWAAAIIGAGAVINSWATR